MSKKTRLDVLLVEQGLLDSRQKAQAHIMAGLVFVTGPRVDKPGTAVANDAQIEVRGRALPYVCLLYTSVASGGGTGRTLHPDNMAAGPASYGMTDTMGRMHSDAQFAGSSSVPAHVEMMGFLGMGNNPMVGATVAVAVAVAESKK